MPRLGLGLSLTTKIVSKYDPNALVYINAVEAADGQPLENNIKTAINTFVLSCKSNNIWSSLKSCCILAGARTLNGALTPLVGPAPTNNFFVSSDYNRITGLKGNGSSKYLSSNYNASSTNQNDHSLGVYIGATSTQVTGKVLIGCGFSSPGASQILVSSGLIQSRNRSGTAFSFNAPIQNGFYGTSRQNSLSYNYNYFGNFGSFTNNSTTPLNENINIFARNLSSPNYSFDRISFYWIGTSLNLSNFNSIVTTLMNDIASA